MRHNYGDYATISTLSHPDSPPPPLLGTGTAPSHDDASEPVGGTWLQTFGRVAIHEPNRVTRLQGSSARLVAVLVAGGPRGVSLEHAADSFWNPGDRPLHWRITLTQSVTRLERQLPEGWAVHHVADRLVLDPADGWIDAWRLAERSNAEHIADPDTAWLFAGAPFDYAQQSHSGDALRRCIIARQYRLAAEQSKLLDMYARGPRPAYRSALSARVWLELHSATKAVLIGADNSNRSEIVARVLQNPTRHATVALAGDAQLAGDLVPYAAAFPTIRERLLDLDTTDTQSAARGAWQLLIAGMEALSISTRHIVIDNAHLLDRASLALTSLLLHYERPLDLRVLVAGDAQKSSAPWQKLLSDAASLNVTVLRTTVLV